MNDKKVDYLGIKNTTFYDVCNHLKYDNDSLYPRNILAYGDDVLYSWDPEENCLVALLTRTLLLNEDKIVQKLRPTEIITHDVQRLVINQQNTRIAIICKTDIYVVELPRKTGRFGSFRGGADSITCSCKRLFIENSSKCFRQVHWHINPEHDYYLAVLSSDNVLYICNVREPKIVDAFVLNKSPRSRIPSLESIGEITVDFYFLPPSSAKSIGPISLKKYLPLAKWPAVILHGNGDIFLIDLTVKNQGQVYGQTSSALLMYPSDEDNYGVDCSGIIVLDAPVPIVVIASSTGIIYHCLLLNHPASDYRNFYLKDTKSVTCVDDSSKTVYVLHVIESVELDLGLNLNSNDNSSSDMINSSPVMLIADNIFCGRYFAVHGAGVHTVCLPIIYDIKIFFSKNYKSHEIQPSVLLDFRKNNCVVEYAVCSQIIGMKPSAILGAVCIDCPKSVLIVLFNRQMISLEVNLWFISPSITNDFMKPSLEKTHDQNAPPSFQVEIKNILHPDNESVPIFKLSTDVNVVPSPHQSLELLARATSYFREIVFPRQQQASQLINKKIKLLSLMEAHQLHDIKQLEVHKLELMDKARSLAEKYEDINEKQMDIVKRTEQFLRFVKSQDKGLTNSERVMLEKIGNYQKTLDRLKIELNQIHEKVETQKEIATQVHKHGPHTYLPDSFCLMAKNILSGWHEDIRSNIDRVVELETDLDSETPLCGINRN